MNEEVNIEQIIDTLKVPATYVNKYYFSLVDNTVRITFAEEHPSGTTVVRSSIAMSIGGFMSLAQMLGPQAEKIKTEFEKHAANKETVQ